MKQAIAAIRYLYIKILHKPLPEALNIELRKPDMLPVVLSKKEVQQIIRVTANLKHKTMLLLLYSAGLLLEKVSLTL